MKFVPLSEVKPGATTDEGDAVRGARFVPLSEINAGKDEPQGARFVPLSEINAKEVEPQEAPDQNLEYQGLEESLVPPASPKRTSVMEELDRQQVPKPLPTEDPMLAPEFVNAVKAQLDALPQDQRQAALERLTARPDVYGRAARVVAGRYAAMDKAQARTARDASDVSPETVLESISKAATFAYDPRLEPQIERFKKQSNLDEDFARFYATLQAKEGRMRPNLDIVRPDIIGDVAAEKAAERAEELKDAGFKERVGAGVESALKQAGFGILNAYADFTGNEQLSNDLINARRIEAAQAKAIPKGESIFERSAQEAMISLTTQAPFMALSVLTGNPAPILSQVAIQKFGDAYGEGRAAGLSGMAATGRAIPLVVAELIFERLGMTKALAGLRAYVAKNGVREIPEYMARATVSEIPPEMATTISEYGIDLLPGIGLNKNPNLADLYNQLEETFRQTILQSGAVASTTIAGTKAAQYGAEAVSPIVSPETRKKLEVLTGPREGAYERDQSYEGLSELIAQAKGLGLRTPVREPQREQREQLKPEAVRTAEEREAEISARAVEIEAVGIPAEDARILAENEVTDRETRYKEQARRLSVDVPTNRVIELAQDRIAAGENPQEALYAAFMQVRQEEESDALAAQEAKTARGKRNVSATQPVKVPTGEGVSVAGQRRTITPTEGVGRTEPTGVVPSERDVTEPAGREGVEPTALAEAPAVDNQAKIAELTAERDKLLLKSGERPAAKSPAGKKFDALNAQIAELETPTTAAKPVEEQIADLDKADAEIADAEKNAVSFGVASAESAFGNVGQYADLQDAVDSARENIADTFDEQGITDPLVKQRLVEAAQKAFDAEVQQRLGKPTGEPSVTETVEAQQTEAQGQKAPRPSRATGKPRGRPVVLTEEERKQKLADKKPLQAEKKRADDAVTRITKTLDKLEQPIDPSKYANNEAVTEAKKERQSNKREAIKELLTMLQSPNLRGTAVHNRIKTALKHPSITPQEITDIQTGLAVLKKTGPTSAVISKDAADSAFSGLTTGAQALARIIKTGTPFQQRLGKRLRGFVNGVKFVVLEEGQELPDQLKKPKNAEQWDRSIALYIENYQTGERVIYVRGESFGEDQGVNNTTILHELLHAATNRKLALAYEMIEKGVNTDSAVVRAAQDLIRTMNSAGTLFNELAANGKLPKEISRLASHGEIFDDPREFVAYGMTDPAMQNFLMQAYGYEDDTPFFNRFVYAIRKLLGMGKDDTNALTDLIIVTDKLLSSRTPAWAKLSGEVVSTITDAFKNWFGNSKVVDKDGNPLVVYHGTTKDIITFKMSPEGALGAGIYLTPSTEYANQYAPRDTTGANIIPAYVSIKNPLIITGLIRDPMVEALVRLGVAERKAESIVEKAYEEKGYIGKQVMTRALAQGYDGIMQYYSDGELSEIVAFSNTQVKSVYNQGTYLIGSGNILQTVLPEESASSSIRSKKVKATPGANVQRIAKMLGAKLYGTPEDISKVSVKELVQNSFDAIKEAIEKGQIKKGKIDVVVNNKDRTIRVIDNGPGMPTSVMGNQFLQIAGTVKGTSRPSGGLGVAKMLFLFENQELEVVSLRDGVVSRLNTTGEELKLAMAANPSTLLEQLKDFISEETLAIIVPLIEADIQKMRESGEQVPEINIEVSEDPKVVETYTKTLFPDGHGTAVIVRIPEGYTDESTGEERDISFSAHSLERAPVLTESPLFDDIEVTFSDGYRTKTLPLGANFPVDEYTSFANVRFAWGVARIYVSKELKGQDYWPRKNAHVLSNGLWQFDISIKDRPGWDGKDIKRNFFIDVSPDPHVRPESAGYPFELNRQGFSKVSQEDFNKIINYITAIYSQVDLAAEVKNFGDVQYVNPDGTLSAKEVLEPKAPPTDNAFTLIKPGDKVEVRDGVLYVNNRAVPELTNDDLKNVSVRIDELTIPQNELDPNRVMIHDNTINKNGESLSDVARQKFGSRYDKYVAGVGQTFMFLRNALVAGGRGGYGELSEQVVGVSVDNEYYGVNITVPFMGMFINPSVTKLSDTPQEIALSMVGTMIHELAHFKVRDHGAEFPAEMQKIMVLLEVFPGIDMRQVQQALTYHIEKNIDVFKFLEEEFKSGNFEPRGNRFKDASAEEISDEGAPKSVGSVSQTGEGRSGLPAIISESIEDTGEVIDDSGDDSETEAVRGAIRSQKEVDKKVAEVSEQFSESVKGAEFAKGVSALQMAQDPRKVLPALRAIWNRATYAQRSALVKLPTTDFLAMWASRAVPELMRTNVLLQKMNGMTVQLLKSAGELVTDIDRAFRADKTLRAKLERITVMATLAEVDPSDTAADERSYRLDRMYADLGLDGQRVYKQIKEYFERLSAYLTKLLDDQITNSNLPLAQKANLMKKIRSIYEQGAKILPYFPLVRVGDYWLAIGTGKTRKFFMFESMVERDNAMQGFADEQIKRKPGESWSAFEKRRADNLEELVTDGTFASGNDVSSLRRASYDSSGLLREIFDAIDTTNLGDQGAKDQLKDAVYQVYLQTMPDQSFRKQFIHRKGITGFSPDLMRNVAHATTKMATQLARIKYAPLLRTSLSAARDSIAGRPRYEPFVKEMERRVADELSFKDASTPQKIAGTLNKASFIWYLGGASSALLQPLSLFQTGMPVLWKYGSVNATREMGRMIKMFGQFGAYKKNSDGTMSWVAPSVEYAKGHTADERRAIREMLARDVTTSTYAGSIFNYKATPTDKRSAPVVQMGKNAVDLLVMGGLMHSTERLSREMMFLASYRLNRQLLAKGSMTPEQAHQAAVDQAVIDTNEALGNYGQYNRPLFMKNAAGKVLTQFMMYPVHVTLFLLKNFVEMIKPMQGRTRKEAIKKFFGTLGTTFILAGATGLPMFSTIMGLIGAAWDKLREDEDWPKDLDRLSFELWFRTVWLEEQLGGTTIGGKKLSAIVERGLVNALTGIDIASRTSLNNLWMRDTKESKTVREGAMALALEKAGPSANMFLSWAEAYEAFSQGDYNKGVQRALPAGFRNFKTAYDLWKEGAKDNKGVEILSRDAFTTGQLIFQAIGFRSDLLANTPYATFKVIGLEQKILNERNELLDRLDREFREKNFTAYKETLSKRVNKFNREYPSYAIEDVGESLMDRAQRRAESFRGFKLTEKNAPLFIKALRPSREAAAAAEKEGRERRLGKE